MIYEAGILPRAFREQNRVKLSVRTDNATRQVLQSHRKAGALVSSPRYEGHGCHPLVFSAVLKAELASISEEKEGLREVMRRHSHEINWVPFYTPVVRLDLNTPEAYQAAIEHLTHTVE